MAGRAWRRIFLAATALARGYAADRKKTDHLLDEAERRAREEKGVLGEMQDGLRELMRLLRAWTLGRYKVVPWKTLTMALAAVIYFVNPFDLLPDFIPLLGFTDDASVIAFVLKSITKDISKFRDWELENARYGVATFPD
ncbi:MAG TPA: YkvA family protein [Terriglobia bacterium]|jgi:uncharacterized membrane protein YkvA (DUF1232 family)